MRPGAGRCPDCGKLIALHFPIHDCTPTANFKREKKRKVVLSSKRRAEAKRTTTVAELKSAAEAVLDEAKDVQSILPTEVRMRMDRLRDLLKLEVK